MKPLDKGEICETYKDIPGYEGYYQVSNIGNVRSISHYTRNNINGGQRYTKGRVLAQYKMPNGYMQVSLSKNEKREKQYVHRLVANTFINNENNKTDVNHIDGDKNNNTVENLEWVSHKDNQIHMVKNRMTLKAIPIINIATGVMYSSLTEAERETGINRKAIREYCKEGRIWKMARK